MYLGITKRTRGPFDQRYFLQEEAEDMRLVHERRNCDVKEMSGSAPAWPLPRSVGGHSDSQSFGVFIGKWGW